MMGILGFLNISIVGDYTMLCAIVQWGVAILAFWLINKLGEKAVSVGYMSMGLQVEDETAPAFNLLYKTLAPVFCQIIFIAGCQVVNAPSLINHNYLIIVYYWVLRTAVVVVTEKARLTNWLLHLVYIAISLTLSYGVHVFSMQMDKIYPTVSTLRDQLWIIVVLFVYGIVNEMKIARNTTEKRKTHYILNRYHKFFSKYGEQVRNFWGGNQQMEVLTFSIMIYENFNRSPFVRMIERLVAKVKGGVFSTGIMQVRCSEVLSDYDSVCLALQKMYRANEGCNGNSYCRNYEILKDYNPDTNYIDAVEDIYNIIKEEVFGGEIKTNEKPEQEQADMDWKEYENYVYDECCRIFGEPNVHKNAKLTGRITEVKRQVDVWVDSSQYGKIAFDAKYYHKEMDVKMVESMIGMYGDLGVDKLVIVTNRSYSKAAIRRAHRGSEKVEADILSIDELKFLQSDGALVFADKCAAFIKSPFAWIVDAKTSNHPSMPAVLYPRHFESLAEAGKNREFAYIQFYDKRVDDAMSIMELRASHRVDSLASDPENTVVWIDDSYHTSRCVMPNHHSVENILYREFDAYILYAVLYCAEDVEKRDLEKMQYLLDSAMSMNVK